MGINKGSFYVLAIVNTLIIYKEMFLDCDRSISVQLFLNRNAKICNNNAKVCTNSAKICSR